MNKEILIEKALEARERAYCPYSKFKVGAAVIFEDGEIYTGCNIENASYGATNCAERTAIYNAVEKGNRKMKAIALVGDVNNYTYPCGICRQVIAEFAEDMKMPIYIIKNKTDYLELTLEKILPGAFTVKDLEN